jgi:hypothetical protein
MSKLPRHVLVVLRLDGTDYSYGDPFPMSGADDEAEVARAAYYQYVEGNYACDCNRSLYIVRHCDNAPEAWPDEDEEGAMPCGQRIELVSLVFVGADGIERVLWPESEDSLGRVRERLAAIGMAPFGIAD